MAVLSYRQQREVELYAGIEPIGGMAGVSSPPATDSDGEGVEARLDAVLDAHEKGHEG